jgi:hypothetical protein
MSIFDGGHPKPQEAYFPGARPPQPNLAAGAADAHVPAGARSRTGCLSVGQRLTDAIAAALSDIAGGRPRMPFLSATQRLRLTRHQQAARRRGRRQQTD